MKYSYDYFKALDEKDKSSIDTGKLNDRDRDRLKELQGQYRSKMSRLKEIRDTESRDLTDEIRAERDVLLQDLKKVVAEIDKFPRSDGNGLCIASNGERSNRGYTVRSAGDKKDFRSLFGSEPMNNYRWTDTETDFYRAVFSGQYHPGLTKRGMVEGVGSEGGFLIPVEQSAEIHNVAVENEIVLPRSNVVPMVGSEKKVPAVDIGDHSANLYGGFIAYYKAEAADLTEVDPKVRQMLLKAKKLTGLLKFSNELLADMSDNGKQLTDICGKGLAWYRDRACLKGTGAGEPLGILNAPCLITVDAENGQTSSTIVYENLVNMMARMHAASFGNSLWICHQSTIPQLLTLTIAVGTGGNHIPVMTRDGKGNFEILTRPVIFTEKTETLGSVGDVILADFSQYAVGLREDMRLDFSPHKYFESDQTLARLISRHDGMPLWDETLTLEDGSTTVSPFVTLAAR